MAKKKTTNGSGVDEGSSSSTPDMAMDQSQDAGALAPADPVSFPDAASRLFHLFRGLDRAHGTYDLFKRPNGGQKVLGSALTVQEQPTVEKWAAHLAGTKGLGIVPIRDDNTCVFGAIDVDKYNLRLDEVEASVAALGLPLLPTRTKSGGVHLYVFTLEPVPARLIKQRLEEWSVALGFGGAEVFPKQNELLSKADTGNWINMPYFNALSGPTPRYGIYKGQVLDVEGYIARAEKIRLTHDQLQALVIDEGDEFAEGPPCLQSLARRKFGSGERNNGLFAVGIYLKKRYPDDWQQHVAAYNVKFMKPPLGEGEVKTVTKALGRKDYGYPCEKPPIQKYCNKSLCRTREFGVGRGNDDWPIVIDAGALKILTDPPYWIVNINGERMMLTTEHFMNQRKFIELCVQRLNVFTFPLAPDKWRGVVQKILMEAKDTEAPHDASPKGELAYHLRQFCTVFPQAETREELLVGKPWTDEGKTHFRAADFKKYLSAQHFRSLEGPRMYQELRALGLEHKQLWVKETNQLVWVVNAYPTHEAQIEVPARVDKQAEGGM